MEDHYAAWAWLGLFIFINVYWISFDLWAKYTHHKLMTWQFRDWMYNPAIGPFLMGLVAFIIVAFLYHMYRVRGMP